MASLTRVTRLRALVALAICWSVPVVTYAQQPGVGTVRGTVTDRISGRALASVQIYVLGSGLGTVTNGAGAYELNLPQGSHQLVARRVGYRIASQPVTVRAGETTEVGFLLNEAAIWLDEVVVTGAGTAVEKKRLGNTVASIAGEELVNAPVRTFSEIIAAREPGVVVDASSGLAGEGARIRIRGSASLSQDNEPVVYVDGIRVDRGGGFGFGEQGFFVGGGGSPSRLDDINPESIDRVEILKGAAAATLYGTEASNGVIQIFTKKGTRGTPTIDFAIEQGFSRIDASRYKPNTGFARDEALVLACQTSPFTCPLGPGFAFRARTPTELSEFWGFEVRPYELIEMDFVDRLLGSGYNSAYSASVSGGTSSYTYFTSVRYATEDGPFTAKRFDGEANDYNRKFQITSNVELIPTDKLRIRVSTLLTDVHHETIENNNNFGAPFSAAQLGHPEQAGCIAAFGRGTPNGDGTCQGVGNPEGSPFVTLREGSLFTVTQDARHWGTSLQLQYTPLPEFTIDGTIGVDVTNTENVEFFPFGWSVDRSIPPGFDDGGRAIDDRNRREITVELKATWDRRFGSITSTLVGGGQGFISRTTRIGGFGASFPGPGLAVAGAGSVQSLFESVLEVVNAGGFVQEQLGFFDVAFLTVGARWDRNSAFGESFGAAFYPKASVSFVPSDLRDWPMAILSTLRLRGAVGQSGLQPSAFAKFTTFAPRASEFGPGVVPDNIGSPDLGPEKSTEWEVGAEFGLLDDRVSVDVTYWDRTTRDALFDRQFAPSGGFLNEQIVNIGRLDAHGFEVAMNTLVIHQPAFSVRLFANASYLEEIITDLGGAPPLKVGGTYPRYRNFLMEGFAPGSYFGAKLAPVASGLTPFDLNGDGQQDTEAEALAWLAVPRTMAELGASGVLVLEDGLDSYLGKPTPDWQGAFGFKADVLRNLEVSTLFEYKAGNYSVHNLTDAFRGTSNIGRNFREASEIEMTLESPASTAEERLDAAMRFATDLKHLDPHSALNAVVKADFVRWRELSATYQLPVSWVQRTLGLRYLAITAAVRNLKLWTSYDGIDPEANLNGRYGDAGSGGVPGIDNNFAQGIDAWPFGLARRFSLSLRFGL